MFCLRPVGYCTASTGRSAKEESALFWSCGAPRYFMATLMERENVADREDVELMMFKT